MKKNNMLPGWLKPKIYKPDNRDDKTLDEELEETLLAIKDAIREDVKKHEQLRSKADDAGQFGEYRYRDGMIAGLTYAGEIVSDYLSDIWGL